MAGAGIAEAAGRLARLSKSCGIALIAAAVLMVAATLLHPSRETATTIVASESRLVAAHVAYTLAWLLVLLGLSRALCGSGRRDGTAGIGRLLDCFLRHLSDRGDGGLRFPGPGLGQAVTGGARLDQPVNARADRQWVGGDPVHDRLHHVGRCHDQARDTAPWVRRPGRRGRSVVAVVLMASPPWMLLQPDQVTRTELNRWFLTVAGSVDAITAGVLLALAQRPRRTLLIVELEGAVIVAGAIILPFQPSFAAILAVGVVPLIAYPYWGEMRMFASWWAGVSRALLILARWRVPGFLPRQLLHTRDRSAGPIRRPVGAGGLTTPKHATVLALAGVLAVSRGPGWRILRGRSVQRGLAIPGTGCRTGAAASPGVLGSHRRRGGTSHRRWIRPRRMARIRK
jgi:hypothetical protein